MAVRGLIVLGFIPTHSQMGARLYGLKLADAEDSQMQLVYRLYESDGCVGTKTHCRAPTNIDILGILPKRIPDIS